MYTIRGYMNKYQYEEYFKCDFSKKSNLFFSELFENYEEELVAYYRFHIDNPDDNKCTFSSLWFFDFGDNGYLPVYKSFINTSSCLALVMLDMDSDDEEEEEEITEDEIIEKFAYNLTENMKQSVKKILLLKNNNNK